MIGGIAGLAVAAALLIALAPGLLPGFLNQGAWRNPTWAEALPKLDGSDPFVIRSLDVFARLKRVADLPAGAEVELRIVEALDIPPAFALGGTVYLTSRAKELAEGDQAGSGRDAELAFVIAHELAHLYRGEHQHAFAAYRRDDASVDATVSELRDRFQQLRQSEVEADRRGLLFALLAGYDLSGLADSPSFFQQWAGLPTTRAAFSSHPRPSDRADFLRTEMKDTARRLKAFWAATRLFQIGRFDDALPLLRQVAKEFPSREVFNNLGLLHYQQAARELARCDGRLVVLYKLPLALEPSTVVDRAVLRGTGRSPCFESADFKAARQAALDAFQRALERSPGYPVARLNTLALHILSQEWARASDQGARLPEETVRDSTDAQLLAALADFGFALDRRNQILIGQALDRLQALNQTHPGHADIVYDLASALDQTGRSQEAERHWEAFLGIESRGPFAERVRERLGLPTPTPPETSLPAPPAPISRQLVEGMPVTPLSGDPRWSVHEDRSLRVLAISGQPVLIEEEAAPISESDLRQRLGPPLEAARTTSGRFLRYSGYGAEFIHGALRRQVWFEEPPPNR